MARNVQTNPDATPIGNIKSHTRGPLTITKDSLVRKPNKYNGLSKKRSVKEYQDIQKSYGE